MDNDKKQELVNENLTELFELPKQSRTIEQTRQSIIRATDNSTSTKDDMINNHIDQKLQQQPVPKKKGRGGARPNSGRKVGSRVKLSATDILEEIAKRDVPFAEGLAEDYAKARQSGDLMVIQRYQQMFLNKLIADKQEMDVTSNGQTIGASFNFAHTELPEWQDDTPTKH